MVEFGDVIEIRIFEARVFTKERALEPGLITKLRIFETSVVAKSSAVEACLGIYESPIFL